MNAVPSISRTAPHRSDPWRAVEALLSDLELHDVMVSEVGSAGLAPARLFEVTPEDWGAVAETARNRHFRWAGGWALDVGQGLGSRSDGNLSAMACFERDGKFLLFRTRLDSAVSELPSHTPHFPGADRPERHTRDMFGLRFKDHPDSRPWTRHQAWGQDQFPLLKSFPPAGHPLALSRPDSGYPFAAADGNGVYEIPVGPVHAGIIEPGHFRFLAVGETVLNLEQHLGYVHKGIEKIAEGRDPEGLARLAGRVSGDSTVAHAWAACMAMERAADVVPPRRALLLRAIWAERERIANHLGDIGAVCNDVSFAFAHYQFSRLRELWQRDSQAWFGHRFMMDMIVPGGVAQDLAPAAAFAMTRKIVELRKELDELRSILDHNSSLQDRLVAAGILSREMARAYGCLGYVARASGIDYDLRRDGAYAPYDGLPVRAVCHQDGDVAARVHVRYDEIYESLDLLEQLLTRLEEGEIRTAWRPPAPGSEGIGLLEGWRGEILCFVRFDQANRIARYYPRDPSVFNWPALEKLIHGNIVPDFPLCNKSVNGSYSGQDL
jgi:Ni,Fe-hydrogenase III large subunit